MKNEEIFRNMMFSINEKIGKLYGKTAKLLGELYGEFEIKRLEMNKIYELR